MLTLPPSVRVFVYLGPADMRRSFDGLAAMARDLIRQDPLSGHLFVFFNRRRDRVKILFWDRTGLVLWYKRLEEGVFKLPVATSPRRTDVEMTWADVSLILEGIDLSGAKRQRRFSLEARDNKPRSR
jgi:transposase